MQSEAELALRRLVEWFRANDIAGWDPYDLRGSRLFLWLSDPARSTRIARGLRLAAHVAERRAPILMRRALRLKPSVNPKGVGLLAHGYLDLFAATGDPLHRDRAVELLKWLQENPSSGGYPGLSWGYPFDWRSVKLIPRGTPSVVVSSTVGNAFIVADRIMPERGYRDVCTRIAMFIAEGLNISRLDDEAICFSYTPLDDFQVHNANLMAAEYLAKAGRLTGNAAWQDLARRAGAYALREQNPDGSLYYWASPQNKYKPNHLDHYHSGFEIRSMLGLGSALESPRFVEAAARYFAFYRNTYFAPAGDLLIPKLTPHRTFPVDIHACAEAILCNVEAQRTLGYGLDLVERVLPWVVQNMQLPDGAFGYRFDPSRRPSLERITYLRWGQAWMFRALTSLLAMSTSEGPSVEMHARRSGIVQ